MIRRQHDNKQVKQATIVAAGQVCAVVMSIPAPAAINRPENGHDTEVPGMA